MLAESISFCILIKLIVFLSSLNLPIAKTIRLDSIIYKKIISLF